jgi:hypothetical protein
MEKFQDISNTLVDMEVKAPFKRFFECISEILISGEEVKGYFPNYNSYLILTNSRFIFIKGSTKQKFYTVPFGAIQGVEINLSSYTKFQLNLKSGDKIKITGSKSKIKPNLEIFQKLASHIQTGNFKDAEMKEIFLSPPALQLIEDLSSRGEKLLKENIGENEEVIAKLKGDFGQGLVITTANLYIIKWGFQTGQIIGGKCIAYDFRNITALEIKKHLMSRIFQVLTPATQDNNNLSYWSNSKNSNSATASDHAVTFSLVKDLQFQEAAKLGRAKISLGHGVHQAPASSYINEIEKLSELKDKGIISQGEFDAKKKKLLGL